jgi:hypothetical protein
MGIALGVLLLANLIAVLLKKRAVAPVETTPPTAVSNPPTESVSK